MKSTILIGNKEYTTKSNYKTLRQLMEQYDLEDESTYKGTKYHDFILDALWLCIAKDNNGKKPFKDKDALMEELEIDEFTKLVQGKINEILWGGNHEPGKK